jgi:hypothetical protein
MVHLLKPINMKEFSMKKILFGTLFASLITATALSAPLTCNGYNPTSSGHGGALYNSVELNSSSQGAFINVRMNGGDKTRYEIVKKESYSNIYRYQLAAVSGPIAGMSGQVLRSDSVFGTLGSSRTSLVIQDFGASLTGLILYEKLNSQGVVVSSIVEPMEICVRALYFQK